MLGFDPTMVMVYKDKDLREKVALQESGAYSIEEALEDPTMSKHIIALCRRRRFLWRVNVKRTVLTYEGLKIM